MVWTAPMTAVANSTFSATEYNVHIRDNLLTSAPAKATAAGQYFVTGRTEHAIEARSIGTQTVATSQTTSSIAYVNLATVGPTATVTCNTEALVWYSAAISNSLLNVSCSVSIAVTGASHYPAENGWWRMLSDGKPANQTARTMACARIVSLTPGSNTFTMKYRVGGGTGTFSDRHLVVMPL